MNFLDNHHIVEGWAPVDINGGAKTSDYISMENYGQCSILLNFGATDSGSDVDIAINASDDVSGSNTAAINNYTLRKSTTSDTWATAVSISDSKIDYVSGGDIVPDTDDDTLVLIEINAADVRGASTSYDMSCLCVSFPNPSNGTVVGCTFILSEPRYGGATPVTAIS